MPLTPFGAKLLLDWVLGGAAASQPTARWIAFATASPTTALANDGTFKDRGTLIYAAANSPQGSATNVQTTSPHVTNTGGIAMTAVGWNMYDASPAGNRLMFGTFSANIGGKDSDTYIVIAGGLKIVLS